MAKAFTLFEIEYKKVSNKIHPTKLTDARGGVLEEFSPTGDIGVHFDDKVKVATNYFFENLYYDSELEKTNIESEIIEVIVFTKIPKNSIKIPVAGGESYSPDFAYVVKLRDGKQKLHFVVESKNVEGEEILGNKENYKIKHAERFFKGLVNIEFRKQLNNDKMVEMINEITINKS